MDEVDGWDDRMGLTLVPGENVVFEEDSVWYYGRPSNEPKLEVGSLVLTNKRMLFYKARAVMASGKPRLETVDLHLETKLADIIGVRVDERVRSKKSKPSFSSPKTFDKIMKGKILINSPPGFLDAKELYFVLIISLRAGQEIDNRVFEVLDPEPWMKNLRNIGASTAEQTPQGSATEGIP